MATLNIFDPITGKTKTIIAEMGGSIVIQDLDAIPDYFVRLSTSARTKAGNAIVPHTIKTLWDGSAAGGTTKHDGSALPYANLSEAIEDHVWEMVEGTIYPSIVPNSGMNFNS